MAAAAATLRAHTGGRVIRLHTVGFCFGGRLSYDAATMDLGLAGVIGFYGWPVGAARSDVPAPADMADRMTGRVLGLFGGADQGIPPEAVAAFEASLAAAGVPHELVTYADAPHSFFDRKHAEFADASADAWARTLAFTAEEGAAVIQDLLDKVLPDYPATGKRTLQDNGTWLKTLRRDNVDLVRTPIERITLWQGMRYGTGLRPTALPTARLAPGASPIRSRR